MMTTEQQRIAIAEWWGYNPTGMERDSAYWTLIPLAIYSKFDGQDKIKHRTCVLPDYPNDLNAIHEAEKKLSVEERVIYVRILHPRGGDNIIADFVLMHKPANERSEALCRTLWPERFE